MRSLFLIPVLCCGILSAQKVILNDSLKKVLLKEASGYFLPTSELSFSISSYDLFKKKPKVTPSLPSTEKRIIELKKKIRQTSQDAAIWNEIGQIYKGLFQKQKADSCFQRALFYILPQLEKHPRDEEILQVAALIYGNKEEPGMAISIYNKILEIDPMDTNSQVMVPILLAQTGDYDGMSKWCAEQVKKHPDLPFAYMFHFMAGALKVISKQGQWSPVHETYYGPKKPEEIFDFSVISKLKWNEEGFGEQKVLYYGLKIMAYMYKGYMVTPPTDKKIKLSDADRAGLEEIGTFLNSLEKDKDYTNHFSINKMQGILHAILGKYPEAIEYFETSLKHFSAKQANFQYNTTEIYNSIIMLHLLVGDTMAAENVLRRKVKEQPGVDPLARDHAWLARCHLWKNDMEGALNECREGMKIQRDHAELHLGLAVIYLHKGSYSIVSQELDMTYKFDNGQSPSVYALAGIQAMLEGKAEDAKSLFKMAADLNPNDKFIQYALKHYF